MIPIVKILPAGRAVWFTLILSLILHRQQDTKYLGPLYQRYMNA